MEFRRLKMSEDLRTSIGSIAILSLAAFAVRNVLLTANTHNGGSKNGNDGDVGIEQLAASTLIVNHGSNKGFSADVIERHSRILRGFGIDPDKVANMPKDEVSKKLRKLLSDS